MAVTYVWRLDSNKYAYLAPPMDIKEQSDCPSGVTEDDWQKYGYLSNSLLTDYFLKNVSDKSAFIAENFDEYEKAFNIMLRKINLAKSEEEGFKQQIDGENEIKTFDWGSLEYIELGNADVYYEMNSITQSDLRGVGIKDIRFIGTIKSDDAYIKDMASDLEGYDDESPKELSRAGSYIDINYLDTDRNEKTESIKVKPGIPGCMDVYGIYMKDQNDNEVPEMKFYVRNGKHGPTGVQGKQGELNPNVVTIEAFNTEIGNINNDINELKEDFNSSQNNIRTLLAFIQNLNGETDLINKLNNIEKSIVTLDSKIQDLQAQINILNNNPSGDGTTLEIHKLKQDGDSYRLLTNEWDDDEYGYGDFENETFLSDGTTQLYLLGFLEKKANDSEIVDSGVAIADKLFAIPNIGINSKGVTIKGGIEVDKITINDILSLTQGAKGYAPSGIFNREPTDDTDGKTAFEGNDTMTFYDDNI